MADGAPPPPPDAPAPAPPHHATPPPPHDAAPPQPSESDPLLPFSRPPRGRRATWRDLARAFLLSCLVFGIPLLIIYTSDQPSYYPPRPQPPCRPAPQPIPMRPIPQVGPLHYTKRELVTIVSVPYGYGYRDAGMSIVEDLSTCGQQWASAGIVRLIRGSPRQTDDYLVDISLAASSQSALDSVTWYQSNQPYRNSIQIRCNVLIPDTMAAIHANITMYVKPYIYDSGNIDVHTYNLDIELAKGLSFHGFDSLKLDSFNGSIVSYANGPDFAFTYISVSCRNGSITGYWSFPAGLTLDVGKSYARNDAAPPIDVHLVPDKRWCDRYPTGFLRATSDSGDISILMPLEGKAQSLRRASVSIKSQHGSIRGTFAIGDKTTLTTGGNGTVTAILRPPNLSYSRIDIETVTQAGNTELEVLPPLFDEYFGAWPLNHTSIKHSSTSGNLSLIYPSLWEGIALGLSQTGNVSISAPDFDSIQESDGLVLGRKGKSLESRLEFTTDAGDAELLVRGSANKSRVYPRL